MLHWASFHLVIYSSNEKEITTNASSFPSSSVDGAWHCWYPSGCCVEPISQLIKCKGRKIVWQQSIEGKRNEEPAAAALEEEFVIRHFLWGIGQGSYHHHSLATHCMSF